MILPTIFALVLLTVSSASADEARCSSMAASDGSPVILNWTKMMESKCIEKMRAQVEIELKAAITYLGMAAHFSRDTMNRPGFAKFFFESANEEREHAIKIIKYLLMRGQLSKDVGTLIQNPYPEQEEWNSGWEALHAALELETEVTKDITELIKTCEKKISNDYHLVDYLSGEFLEEQYKGQRDLAGKLLTLEKMNSTYGGLGEYLFDKKLLDEEISLLF